MADEGEEVMLSPEERTLDAIKTDLDFLQSERFLSSQEVANLISFYGRKNLATIKNFYDLVFKAMGFVVRVNEIYRGITTEDSFNLGGSTVLDGSSFDDRIVKIASDAKEKKLLDRRGEFLRTIKILKDQAQQVPDAHM